jgi:hypothetical protein
MSLDPSAPTAREPLRETRLVRDATQRGGGRGGITRGHEQATFAVHHDFGYAAHGGRDDRRAVGHRLNDHEWRDLSSGNKQRLRGPQEAGYIGARPGEIDPVRDPEPARERLDLLPIDGIGLGPGELQDRIDAVRAQHADGRDGKVLPLVPVDRAHDQDLEGRPRVAPHRSQRWRRQWDADTIENDAGTRCPEGTCGRIRDRDDSVRKCAVKAKEPAGRGGIRGLLHVHHARDAGQVRGDHRSHEHRAVGDDGIHSAMARDRRKPDGVGHSARQLERPPATGRAPYRDPGGAANDRPQPLELRPQWTFANRNDEFVIARQRFCLVERDELRSRELGAVHGEK